MSRQTLALIFDLVFFKLACDLPEVKDRLVPLSLSVWPSLRTTRTLLEVWTAQVVAFEPT